MKIIKYTKKIIDIKSFSTFINNVFYNKNKRLLLKNIQPKVNYKKFLF